MAHRFLPPIRRLAATDGNGASRFSRVKFLYMHGVFDSAESASHSRFRAPPFCLPDCVTPSALWIRYFGAHQLQGYPACICPCPTLQVQPHDCPHMARGQSGSLFLSLYDSFIHYFTPVYPDAIHAGVRAPRAV